MLPETTTGSTGQPPTPDHEASQIRALPRPRWAVVTLLACVGYSPLALYAGQGHVLARGYRLIWYVVAVSLGLSLLAWVVARFLPVRLATAWFALSLTWLILSAGGPLAENLGGWLMVGLMALLVVIVLLLDKSRSLDTLMVALTVYLAFSGISALIDGSDPGDREAGASVLPVAGNVGAPSTPDVWFLILDGYPSETSRVADFGGGEDSLADTLEGEGFVVEGNALAPYTRTVGALPSILAGTMTFPAGSVQDEADMVAAAEIVGGESTLVSGLGEIGYHTTMIESGWHLSRCGPAVDTCIESSLLDEMGSALVSASILPQVIEVDRHVSSMVGTQRTFSVLYDLSTAYAQNGRPDLVIAHSLAPHPPMLLDAECESQGPSPTRSSLLLAFEGWDAALIAERAETFRDQVTCIDSLVTSFVQSLPAETGVVVVGDHGSEIRGQVSVPPLGWDEAMLRERLQTLAAVRFPGCEPSVRATIEVVPELLSCLGLEVEDPALSAQIMANVKQADGSEYPLYEIPPDQVRRLLAPG